MLKTLLSVGAMTLLAVSTAQASFLPPNTLHLEDTVLRSNVSEAEFNDAIDKAEEFYKPRIKEAFGGKLKVNRRWDDSTVNASASQMWGTWSANMYGGLARRPEVTTDGFTLVICHEIGHHVAGFPFSSSWAGDEGQSDYFATLSCARELWREEVETNAAFRDIVPEFPKALCDKVWTNELDQDLCYRSMMGGKSLADLLSALRDTEVDFETPSQNKVNKTSHSHPAGQCRLDTYMAGALCDAEWNPLEIPGKDLGRQRNSADAEEDSAQYTCSRSQDFEIGVRPNCWFASQL